VVNQLPATDRTIWQPALSSRNISAHVVPSNESLCEKTGKQIAGWVRMSHDHVSHGGPKYIILSVSGRGMSLV